MGEAVAVFGGGARNHGISDNYITRSSEITKVYWINGEEAVKATEKGKKGYIEHVRIDKLEDVVKFCLDKKVAFLDIGSEDPLGLGLVDMAAASGLFAIGPVAEYVKLESNRAFTDEHLKERGIPKPEWKKFSDPEEAKSYVLRKQYQVAVKPNGLAGGKGVILCDDVDDAFEAIDDIMVRKIFKEAGNEIVIEERKAHNEISFFAFLDGKGYLPVPIFCQDFKPAFDPGNIEAIERYNEAENKRRKQEKRPLIHRNPNSGGFGCVAPHPEWRQSLTNRILKEIVNPTVDMIYYDLGWGYKGIVYWGLNLDPETGRLEILEINVRGGDAEWQTLLRKLLTDPFEIAMAIKEGTLHKVRLRLNDRHYVNLVGAPGRARRAKEDGGGWYQGYPGSYGKGYLINGLDKLDRGVGLYFGGTGLNEDGLIISTGSRPINIIGSGATLAEATQQAYENMFKVKMLDHRNGGKDILYYRKTVGDSKILAKLFH